MKNKEKYHLSFSAEFTDKTLERDYVQSYMRYYSGFMGQVTLAFGIVFMMFLFADYFAVDHASFVFICIVRALFLMASVLMYLYIRGSCRYCRFARWITVYETLTVIAFLTILSQYKSISLMCFFSVMAITLAIYMIPNRMINAQILSALLNLSFFLLFANRVAGMGKKMLLEMIAYALIFLIFGNIEAHVANLYMRIQYADSLELLKLYLTDPLTGIYNRAKFDQELKRWIDYCKRYSEPLSLVIFDVDDFKKVNDTYGHLTGDVVLQSVTSVIRCAVRGTDIFARWGGDEFALLLPNTDNQNAMETIRRLKHRIAENQYDTVGKVTCSFGLAFLLENESAESILQRADQLLYDAKRQGKDMIAWIREDTRVEFVS